MQNKKHPPMVAVIIKRNGKILCLDHVKEGKWTIPMGKVDEGEKSPLNAIQRELWEELNIKNVKTKHVVSIPIKMFAGDIVIWDVFEVIGYNGTIVNKEPEKHLGMEYFSLDEIKKMYEQNKVGIIVHHLLDSNLFH